MAKHKKFKESSLIKEITFFVVLASVITIIVRGFLMQPFYIPSSSMEDTLEINDTILVSKLTPEIFDLKRGDVVVFKDPNNWLSHSSNESSRSIIEKVFDVLSFGTTSNNGYLIKRVIGLPGDTVECEGSGKPILVNGVKLYEPYIKNRTVPSDMPFKVKVPQGRIWVMGDNRDNSADSRYHMEEKYEGTISMDDVVGKAKVIIWPLSRISTIKNTLDYDKS